MILVKPGIDIIDIGDEEYNNINKKNKKIHLIRIKFTNPNKEKMDWLLSSYETTNRFIVFDNIKFYNWYFKQNNRKFYVENNKTFGIFSFFKKNNKVLLNINVLSDETKKIVMIDEIFEDILKNLEIIQLDEISYTNKKEVLKSWSGNVIINNE